MRRSLTHAGTALALLSCVMLGAGGCGDDAADVASGGGDAAPAEPDTDASATSTAGSGSVGGDAAACEAPPDADESAVDVVLADASIEADPEAAAGDIVFTVRNDGTTTHQLAIYRGPLDGVDPRNLDRAGLVTQFESLPAGGSCNHTVTLAAGDYLLVCIVPGHAGSGMVSGLTVT